MKTLKTDQFERSSVGVSEPHISEMIVNSRDHVEESLKSLTPIQHQGDYLTRQQLPSICINGGANICTTGCSTEQSPRKQIIY